MRGATAIVNAPPVLAVDPGAGSTKVALFRGEVLEKEERVLHPGVTQRAAVRADDDLARRIEAVRAFLGRCGVGPPGLAAVVARGGLLPPLRAGTYAVDDAMLADLARAEQGEHASNLGAPIASAIAAEHGCPALVVDPVSVDELDEVARVTGVLGIERRSLTHALNIRATARRFARERGAALETLRLVVAHMGTGVSLAAFREGRMFDVVNPRDEGPFSGDRAGGVPVTAVVDLCFAQGAERRLVVRRLFGDGGLYSHLGTRDAREALRRADAGDERAQLVLDAMCLGIAKAIAGLAAALEGKVDAVLLTGGMAHLAPVVEAVRRRVAFIAPVHVYPGEDELRSLAEGALRVLRDDEPAQSYAARAPVR